MPSTNDFDIIVNAILNQTSLKKIKGDIVKIQTDVEKELTKVTTKQLGKDYDLTQVIDQNKQVISETRDYASALKRLTKEKEVAQQEANKLSNKIANTRLELEKLGQAGKLTSEEISIFNQRLNDIGSAFSGIENPSKAFDDLSLSIKKTANANEQASKAINEQAKADEKLAKAQQEVSNGTTIMNNKFDSFSNKLLNAKNSGKITEEQFNELSKSLSQIKTNFNNSGKGVEDFNKASFESTDGLQKLNNKLGQYTAESKQASNLTKELGNNIRKFTEWYLIAGVVTVLIRKFKDMFQQVKMLDDALVELKKVTDLSGDSLDDYTKRAFELGKQLRTTGVDVINASTEFARSGYSEQEALDLAKVAIKLTNVADGITDTGKSANILISVLKGSGIQFKDFNDELAMAKNLLDQLNAISNNNAVSFDKLADMVQSVSATMATLQNNTKETLALLNGAYEVLKDTRVAKGISVIGLRIAGLNEDLEEEEGLASKVGEALEKYAGVKVFDEQRGQLRSTYDILEELSGKWNTLTKNAQAYITATLAGKNRADVLNALMQNWEGVQSAMEDATNSLGSADKEMEAYYDSIEAHIQSFNNAFQELSNNFIESNLVKGIVDIGTFIIDLIDDLGGLQIVLLEILGIIVAFNLEKIISGGKTLITTITNIVKNLNVFKYKITDVTGQVQNMTTTMQLAQASVLALTLAISAGILIYNKWKQAEEERARLIQENYDNAIENYEREIDKLEDLEDSYLRLYNKNNKTTSQKEELIKLTKELAKANGLEYDSIKKNNEGYLEANELYQNLIERRKKELEKELEGIRESFQKNQIYLSEIIKENLSSYGSNIPKDLLEKFDESISFEQSEDYITLYFKDNRDEYLEFLKEWKNGLLDIGLDNLDKGQKKTLEFINKEIADLEENLKNAHEQIDKFKDTENLLKFYEEAGGEVAKLQEKLNNFNNMTLKQQADAFQSISKEIDALKKKYENLEGASGFIDEITNQFNEQVEILKKEDFLLNEMQDQLSSLKKLKEARDEELKQQEKLLKVEEARAKLAEAMNKRVRVYRQGQGFVYETDYSEVQDAQEDLAQAIRDAELDDLSQAIKNLTKAIDIYNKVQSEQGDSNALREYFMSSTNRDAFMAMDYQSKINKLKEFAPNVDWEKFFSNELDDFSSNWISNKIPTTNNSSINNSNNIPNLSIPSNGLKDSLLGDKFKRPTSYLKKEILKTNSIVQNIGNITLPNVTNTNKFITELTKIGNPSLVRK